MTFISHLAASLAIVAFSLSAVAAEPMSTATMFARMSALASTGNADIHYNLGMFLNNGIGTRADPAAAFKHFSAAAAAGHVLAAFKVGCYLDGQFPGTVTVDRAEAMKFKLRAAEAGYALAQYDVGLHYARLGDAANARLWWERASQQGELLSTAVLAQQWSAEASPDKVKGYALMLLVQAQLPKVPPELTARIDQVGAQLSPEDKAAADTLRASWVTGETPLTQQAKATVGAVPALIASLEH